MVLQGGLLASLREVNRQIRFSAFEELAVLINYEKLHGSWLVLDGNLEIHRTLLQHLYVARLLVHNERVIAGLSRYYSEQLVVKALDLPKGLLELLFRVHGVLFAEFILNLIAMEW